jgi:hypothetical protein
VELLVYYGMQLIGQCQFSIPANVSWGEGGALCFSSRVRRPPPVYFPTSALDLLIGCRFWIGKCRDDVLGDKGVALWIRGDVTFDLDRKLLSFETIFEP